MRAATLITLEAPALRVRVGGRVTAESSLGEVYDALAGATFGVGGDDPLLLLAVTASGELLAHATSTMLAEDEMLDGFIDAVVEALAQQREG